MFPASTYKGGAVLAFPSVCKMPGPPAPPVAAPFPNVGSKQSGQASKAPAGSKTPVAAKDASQNDLHKALDDLHNTIKSMGTRDANACARGCGQLRHGRGGGLHEREEPPPGISVRRISAVCSLERRGDRRIGRPNTGTGQFDGAALKSRR